MNADKPKAAADKPVAPTDKPADTKTTLPAKRTVPPLFRRIDWLAMLIAFGVVWVTYMITLAPELTLEDSGELCTGAFYAGIPHPPGYPVWTIYSWLWTVLLPFHNVAWRVEVGEATAAAFASGLVGLMVSRGSSMLMEGIEDLKSLTGKWENVICLVCGAVAGVLLGMGGVMWSESVAINRISLFGVPWVTTVMLCMLRWIYAPHQRRYLFCALFFFGICLTIHQTLLVAAMGIEAAIAYCQPRLGRTLFLGNSVIYILGVIAHHLRLTTAFDTPMIFIIFQAVGIASVTAYFCYALFTKETFEEFGLDASLAVGFISAVLAVEGQGKLYWLVVVVAFVGFIVMAVRTWKLGYEWLVALICVGLWVMGAMFYFYEPIAGMTNPPMQWGYPRTWDGFIHAFTRGQYEKVNPTDIFGDPGRFFTQLGMLASDLAGEYNWVLMLVALVPLFFFLKLRKRERTWLTCLTGTYLCISVLLIILMNPSDDRASADLHKVFFTSSHALIAIMIGYGLALTAAYMATHYERFRRWGLVGGGITAALALFCLLEVTGFFSGISGFSGLNNTNSNGFIRWILTLADCVGSMAGWGAQSIGRLFEPHRYGPFFHALFKAFQKDQYGLPIYGHLILLALPLALVAALLAYRKRAPLAIALGLFALLPLYSGLCHWGGSEQRNHWFGYWFGHDMFTPPFTGPDSKLTYDAKQREQAIKGPAGRLVYPEMARDTILFGGTDPGRFCPTYMVFCESFIPHKDQPVQDQTFDRRDVYIITQNALADNTYLEYIRAHYNRSAQIDPPFFQEMLRSKKEVDEGYTTNSLARLAYQLLDRPFTSLGARIERRRREEGVYPPKEIYIPTAEDSSKCFNEYMTDAERRLDHDMRFPNEPHQVRQGEGVEPHTNSAGGISISVSGQTAVMAINGLLTKVIFDHNPNNEFYVEESFPLDWMYPYLSPYGIIMKINREPVAELSQDTIDRDHEFWSKYSDRLIGNIINYDTSVKDIAAFVEKVYLERDFSGFKGDRRFIRDDQAQKAFSKLRSSIASSIYDWRYQTTRNAADKQRMLKEADFAYKQAFAFCPYSPEAVYHYIYMLVNLGRVDDALIVVNTCAKLDPNNLAVAGMVKNITDIKNQHGANVEELEKEVRDNPTNFQAAFTLAQVYMQMQQRDKAVAVLDQTLDNPKINIQALMFLAQAYSAMGNAPKLETALLKLTQLAPGSPEAWHDLAALEATLGRAPEAMKALRRCLDENDKRLAQNPKATNFRLSAGTDPNFVSLRPLTEFQDLIKAK